MLGLMVFGCMFCGPEEASAGCGDYLFPLDGPRHLMVYASFFDEVEPASPACHGPGCNQAPNPIPEGCAMGLAPRGEHLPVHLCGADEGSTDDLALRKAWTAVGDSAGKELRRKMRLLRPPCGLG